MPLNNRVSTIVVTWCMVVALPSLCLVAAAGQGEQARPRQIRKLAFSPSPIAERLRPDDEIVVVEWNLDVAVFDTEPTSFEAVKIAVTGLASTTAIVTVTGASGVLALENSWVHTKFVATVDDVLRTGKELQSRDRVSRGQSIEFHVHGGEAAVRGVIVRARDVVAYPLGRKYLVFLGRRAHENGWTVTDSVPLLIEGDRLSAVAPATSRLTGLTLADVTKAIRETR